MGVIRPNKFFNRESVIQQILNTSQEPVNINPSQIYSLTFYNDGLTPVNDMLTHISGNNYTLKHHKSSPAMNDSMYPFANVFSDVSEIGGPWSVDLSSDAGIIVVGSNYTSMSGADGDTARTILISSGHLGEVLSNIYTQPAATYLEINFDFDNVTYRIDFTQVEYEKQKIEFDYPIYTGSWKLGLNSGVYITVGPGESAATIQSNLRNLSGFTAVWGPNVTVTGDESTGFVIQQSDGYFGNLDPVYYDVGTSASHKSMSSYVSSAPFYNNWSSSNNTTGTPNQSNSQEDVGAVAMSSTIFLQFDFDNYPSVIPDGIAIKLWREGNVRDNQIQLGYNSGAGYSLGSNYADSGYGWSSILYPNYKTYGSNSDLWGITQDGSAWATLINNNIGLLVQANNTTEYNEYAYIDAAYMEIFFSYAPNLTLTTLYDGG